MNGDMKRIFFCSLVLGLVAGGAHAADVSIATVAAEAAENTFAGHNYSWHTVVTRPDGTTVDLVGQADRDTNAVSVQDGARNFQSVTVDHVHFVLGTEGWKKLLEPAGGEKGLPPPPPPSDVASAPSESAPHLSRGGHGPGFGGPRFFAPADNISHLIERISTWSASDNAIVGTFSGPAHHHRGKGNTDGTESSVLSLWIQDGLITKAQLVTTRPALDVSGAAKTEKIVTTITAVGSTTINVPAEVQALLTSTS